MMRLAQLTPEEIEALKREVARAGFKQTAAELELHDETLTKALAERGLSRSVARNIRAYLSTLEQVNAAE